MAGLLRRCGLVLVMRRHLDSLGGGGKVRILRCDVAGAYCYLDLVWGTAAHVWLRLHIVGPQV